MELFMPFEELNSYVKERFGQRVALSCVNKRVLRVTYIQRIIIKDVNINIEITIDEVKDAAVEVTYDGALGLDMLIGGALTFFKNAMPELSQGIHPGSNHKIMINLAEIEKAKPVVENIALRYISVEPNGLKIGFDFKIPKN